MKVYLATLGCKLNQSELEDWSRQFEQDGHQVVNDPRDAELCVLNTCTVTHVAARKSRQLARHVARISPGARVVLTGCYASMALQEAARLPNVALVVPNADKDRLAALAGSLFGDVRYRGTETGCRLPEAASGELASSLGSQVGGDTGPMSSHSVFSQTHLRTRAFVKIQDGCDMACTYCIIPLARGGERSRPRQEVLAQVKTLVAAGYKEIILTGVQISDYRDGTAGRDGLRELIAEILAETNVPRLRLTSLAPWHLDESLLDLWHDARLCRHLHLSLQSGSDTVLRRMRRPYSTARFARAVELARERIPDVAVTSDVIVGFPGESDVEFYSGMRFIESMGLARVHVFPYSAREGTLAANLPLQVSEPAKQTRASMMQAVADASARAFVRQFVGRTLEVLWETAGEGTKAADDVSRAPEASPPSSSVSLSQCWTGYTDNYIRVATASEAELHNRISRVRLTGAVDQYAVGDLIS